MEYANFSGGYTPYLYLVLSALRLGLPSSPIELYVSIGLGISVSETKFMLPYVLGYLCWKTKLGPSQGLIQRGWVDTPNLLEKSKSTFKCVAKIHALECKINLFNINAPRMSDSFTDVMSSLYMLLASFLS